MRCFICVEKKCKRKKARSLSHQCWFGKCFTRVQANLYSVHFLLLLFLPSFEINMYFLSRNNKKITAQNTYWMCWVQMHRFDFIYLLLLYVLGNALGSTSSKNANATLLLLVLFVSHKLLCVDAECGCFVVYLILCHYHFSRNAHIHGRTHEIRKKTLSTYFFIGCSRSIRIILLLQCFFQFFLLFV